MTMIDQVPTETRIYRDFELTAMQHAGGWQVHIYPTRIGVSKPNPDYAAAMDKEAAFKGAESIIDAQSS
jgi:hypothetical protein